MSRYSSEINVIGNDPMEHYKNIISELLLGREGSFSTGVTKHTELVVAQYNRKVGEDSLPLFMEEIRGLTKCDMERLNHALREVFTILNDDVDEVQYFTF
ncbi:Telomere repeat-binding protein 4 [Hordeum vulgare]|nr:Telomere repeat-binding protein 4 [Hordeum vulgare]